MKRPRLISWHNFFYFFYAALLLIWIRSFIARDEVYLNCLGRLCLVNSFDNHLHIHWLFAHDYAGPILRLALAQQQIKMHGIYLELRAGRDAYGWWVAIPYWLPLLFMTAFPIWRTWTGMVRRRRLRQGRCLHCGYDLRMSGDICPECGCANHQRPGD